MKKILPLAILLLCFITAKAQVQFVNYGPGAEPTEGDNNYIQVINFEIPPDYAGPIWLRLFDIGCGSANDLPFGPFNSMFVVSLYQTELQETDFVKVSNYRNLVKEKLLRQNVAGNEKKYLDGWINFADLNFERKEDLKFSLVVEGIRGNDANKYQVALSSDSTSNKTVEGVRIYSYEPTVAVKEGMPKWALKFLPGRNSGNITLYAFDLDGTGISLNTLLRDEIRSAVNNGNNWLKLHLPPAEFELDNFCSVSIDRETKEYNDLTLYVTDSKGKRIPLQWPPYPKENPDIPTASKSVKYNDCFSVKYDLSGSASKKGNPLSYRWIFDDGSTAEGAAAEKIYPKAGIYNTRVLITEKSDAVTRGIVEKFSIELKDRPVAVAGDNIIGIPGKPVNFNADRSYSTNAKIIDYEWNFGDGASAKGIKTSHAFIAPGKYSVKLTVKNDFIPVCNSATDSLIVIINSKPVPVAEKTVAGAVNQPILFNASKSYDSDGSIIKYLWDFGNNTIKEGKVVDYKFNAPGTYNVKLIVKDNSNAENDSASDIVKVVINAGPKASPGTDKMAWINQPVFFDGSKSTDSDGRIIEYLWDFGDGTLLKGEKVSHVYNKPGKYSIVLKVQDNSGQLNQFDRDSISVAVNPLPFAQGKKIYLKGSTFRFDAARDFSVANLNTKYEWSFGDGASMEGKKIKHDYKYPGTFRVSLKITDIIASTTASVYDSVTLIINKRPVSDAGPDRIAAINQNIQFDSRNSVDPDGTIAKTRWFINGRLLSENAVFDYQFSKPGNYLVGLEVTDNYPYPLTGISYAKVKVNNPPSPVISAGKKCAPLQNVKFDGSKSSDTDGSIIEYLWNFSDGDSKSGKTVDKSFRNPGSYSVILTVKDNSGALNSSASDTITIKVNNSPVIKAKETIESCYGRVNIDASSTSDPDGDPISFVWTLPGAKGEKSGGVFVADFKDAGDYPVVVSADDGENLSNSIAQKTIIVKIRKPPVADAGKDTTVCAGDIVILNGLKSYSPNKLPLSYEWTFDDSTKLEGSSVFRTFKKSGLYSVILKVTDNTEGICNYGVASKLIKVVEAPVADAGTDLSACAFSPVKFDGSKSVSPGSNIISYLWDFGDGETGSGVTVTHVFTKPGRYKVSLTITSDMKSRCDNTSTASITAVIAEAPSASFAAPDSVAEKQTVEFDAGASSTSSGEIISYKWDFGDGTAAEGKTAKHSYPVAGKYNVKLSIKTNQNNECNTVSVNKMIFVNRSPSANIKVRRKGAVGENISFSGFDSYDEDGKIAEYLWNFGGGVVKKGINVTHSFQSPGKYKVFLKATDDTGTINNSSIDSVEIVINDSPIPGFILKEKEYINREVVLDSRASSDSDGKIVSCRWFVDNVPVSDQPVYKTNFLKPGKYSVRLSVKDDSGQLNDTGELTRFIEIFDNPKVSIPERIDAAPDELFNIEPVIEEPFAKAGIAYIWSSNWQSFRSESKKLSLKLPKPGKYAFSFELTDAGGKLLSDSLTVFINSSPVIPALKDTVIYIGMANDEIMFDASGAYDPDGDMLSVSWDFGDGNKSSLPITTHRYSKEGKYTVQLEINDQRGTSCSRVKAAFIVHAKKSE